MSNEFTSDLKIIPSFFDVGNATKIILPNATEVDERAFYNNRLIQHVYAPLLQKVGEAAFMYCNQLDLRCLSHVSIFGIRACAHAGNGGDVLLAACSFIGPEAFICSRVGIVTGPDVRDVGKAAFRGATAIAILMPRLMHIPYCFARDCKHLREVHCPNVSSIGIAAFSDCHMLSVALFGTIEQVPVRCFYSCSRLAEFDLCNTNSIACEAFSGSGIVNVTSRRLTSIGQNAFRYCQKLKLVYIPECRRVGPRAFERACGGVDIDFGMPLPESEVVFGPYAFAYAQIRSVNCNRRLQVGYAAFAASSIGRFYAPMTAELYACAFMDAKILSPLKLDCVKTVGASVFERASFVSATLNNATCFSHSVFKMCNARRVRIDAVADLPQEAFAGAKVTELSAAKVTNVGPGSFYNANIGRLSCVVQNAKNANGPTFYLHLSGRRREICTLSTRAFWRVLSIVVLSLRSRKLCDDIIRLVLWHIPDERYISCHSTRRVCH